MRWKGLVLSVALVLGALGLSGTRARADAPANDAFASATSLGTGSTATLRGSNVEATGERGEPNHAGAALGPGCSDAVTPSNACESSVWYTWSPALGGAYTIDLCQSNVGAAPNRGSASTFDTVLAVYMGSELANLQEVVSNDQTLDTGATACPNPNASKVVFTASAGTTYYVAVAGFEASKGTIYGVLEPCSFQGADCPPPAVVTGAATAGPTSATLTGTVNPEGQSTTYQFEYGTTTSYGQTAPASPADAGSGSAHRAVSVAIGGLARGTTYHYRLDATNGSGTTKGSDLTFRTLATPVATTRDATNVRDTSATLNATVNGSGLSSTFHFDYGTDSTFGTHSSTPNTPVPGPGDQSVHADVTALTGHTTYYFRVVATNSDGTTTDSPGRIFTTPSAVTEPATDVSSTSATMNGLINPEGQTASYHFEWGTGSAPHANRTASVPVGSGTVDQQESAGLSGLTRGTTYTFRIVLTDPGGNTVLATGADRTFTTNDVPTVTTGEVSNASSSGGGCPCATLNGTINPNGSAVTDYHFKWGTSSDPNQDTFTTPPGTLPAGSSPVAVSADLTRLTLGQTYYFELVATNGEGTATGALRSFVAGDSPAVSTSAATGVTGTRATLKGTIDPKGQDTSYHFAYGTTSGQYTTATPDGSISGSGGPQDVSATVTGLSPGMRYFYVAVASNGSGTTQGGEQSFVTPKATTGSATSVTGTSATLNGTVNPEGQSGMTVHFDYGTDSTFATKSSTPESSALQPNTNDQPVSANVTGLSPATTYYFRVVARTADGSTIGGTSTFTTLKLSTVTTGPASDVTATTATLNGSFDAGGDAATYHFEYGLTTSYGTSTAVQAVPAGGGVLNVSAPVTGLIQGVVYHYRLVVTTAGGTVNGADETFIPCVVCSDFDRNNTRDIVLYNPQTGQAGLWYMSGTSFRAGVQIDHVITTPNWHPVASADFNGDGKPDIFWYNPSSQLAVVWFMDNAHYVDGARIDHTASSSAWSPVALGDFNGDGKPDIVWHNSSNGQVAIWLLDGTHFVTGGLTGGSSSASLAWTPFASADFTGDGRPDIAWHNSSTGKLVVWEMDGTTKVQGLRVSRGAGLSWVPTGAGDFDRDGKPDILWQNTSTGQVVVWLMNRATYLSGRTVTGRPGQPPNPPPSFFLV